MMSLPKIEVSFRRFPDETADGIHVSHITDDVEILSIVVDRRSA